MLKKPKLIGKDEDGLYLGKIEQIETHSGGLIDKTNYDILDISNRKPNLWIFSLLDGYRQVGQFKVLSPHKFKEGDLVIVHKKDNKIIDVQIEDNHLIIDKLAIKYRQENKDE